CRETGWRSVTYYHVALDHHSILIAEGLPAESYINTGNGSLFANSPMPLVLHPDLTDAAIHPTREAASCAPFASAEADVRPVWQHVADRSARLGYPVVNRATTTDAGLHLLSGTKRVESILTDTDRALFVLPPGLSEVQIVSRAEPPSEARPWLEDCRRLGVRINRIILRDGCELYEIPLDDPRLTDGWWAVERDGRSISRWTNGCALLPLSEPSRFTILEIQLAGTMIYASPIAGSATTMCPVAA
ncbi:MAG TPA: Hint domain-containing protein, partial [Acetobacteraceae bacterium]|nr:Hint domain-containing protein [Acetobacteraceae bacterium]